MELGEPYSQKAYSPLVIPLRKRQIFVKFCGAKDASCKPIIGEMTSEARQIEDIDTDAQDHSRRKEGKHLREVFRRDFVHEEPIRSHPGSDMAITASVEYISASANRFNHTAAASSSSLVAFGSGKLIALWDTQVGFPLVGAVI
jgi:hypothetical protein